MQDYIQQLQNNISLEFLQNSYKNNQYASR